MIYAYKGPFSYNKEIISAWDSTAIGVYYCIRLYADGSWQVLYVGRATGKDGIRGRLLRHLNDGEWPDVNRFGYTICSTSEEAIAHEASEIKKIQPPYNDKGK